MNKLLASSADLDNIKQLMKFLKASFHGSRIGELSMDDCIDSLAAVLSTATPTVDEKMSHNKKDRVMFSPPHRGEVVFLRKTIPNTMRPTLQAMHQISIDMGIEYDNGVPYAGNIRFIRVRDNPLKGQYSLLENGIYQFSELDHEEKIIITYAIPLK